MRLPSGTWSDLDRIRLIGRLIHFLEIKMSITKQYILFFIVFAIFFGAYIKYGRADSVICDDLIFTETSDIEITPTAPDGTVFKGIIQVKQIKVFGAGARINLHTGSEIYFNQMSQCMSIEDEVDSVKNLKWFLKKSIDARISNWKHRR